MAKARPFGFKATYVPVSKRSCSRSQKKPTGENQPISLSFFLQ
ncbi:hypothetical protein HMPREF0530_1542 [Lacticaseibacillus paracasei subsp. paracasei ATCC 25302 = DSM 5622 = JCM 8130]|nr:hypothetical protein HMPREF0530_1542 [Lacticaseibacillus paracasei subsp. paracasei ATCC 25302 = DSM 5622 = JCM 8130]BAN72093.1 conserved hypothetical protein [Lacticaseibacillus paracasei subsp. paracasei]